MDNTYRPDYQNQPGAPVKVAAGTSFIEGITGIGAVALSIIGLANIFPLVLASIATIALGAALLFEAGAVAARFSALMSVPGDTATTTSRWGGMTSTFLAGAAGIALGILSLLGISPMVLIPIAAIVFGSALIMDSGVNARLAQLEASREAPELSDDVARESAMASSGIEVLVGLGAITLGVLALVGFNTLTLTLVALLSVGSAVLLSGSIIGGRMISVFKR